MEDVVVYALLIWIAVSILALAVQLVRRWRYRRTVATGHGAPLASNDVAGSGLTLAGAPPETIPDTTSATTPDPAPDASPAAMITARPAEPSSTEDSAAEAVTEQSSGVDETPPSPDDRRGDVEPDATIASLIRGIRLPNGLTPVEAEMRAGAAVDHAVRLRTESAPAGIAGVTFADEVERGGYEIMSISDDEAVARRGEDLFSMKIRPITIVAERADAAAPPEVSEAVEIDLWVGGGPSPFA